MSVLIVLVFIFCGVVLFGYLAEWVDEYGWIGWVALLIGLYVFAKLLFKV